MTSELTFAPGSPSVDLLRRLRAWSVSSWRHGERIDHVRAALSALAELASERDGRLRPAVPPAGVHALVDQLIVLAADAFRAGASQTEVDGVFATLSVRLSLTTP